MIPFTGDSSKATAVFFNEQTVQALQDAVNLFEQLEFDPAFLRAHAQYFDESQFVLKIRSYVQSRYLSERKVVPLILNTDSSYNNLA
jgi:hypothetical protein